MQETTLNSFLNTLSNNYLLVSPTCLHVLLIYWRRCSSLIPTNVLQVQGKDILIYHSSFLNYNLFKITLLLRVSQPFLQLKRRLAIRICQLFTIAMTSPFAHDLSVLILSNPPSVKSKSRNLYGRNLLNSIRTRI